MSPEIRYSHPFDGHAVDLWAVGVILFMMLTGGQPWDRADLTDGEFRNISQGNLAEHLINYNLDLSDEAVDLMQRMFKLYPRERLSINQIRAHPWMNLPMENPIDENGS